MWFSRLARLPPGARYTVNASPILCYVNGKYLPEDQAVLPVKDLGILRGFGCFDYFRTYSGKAVTLELNVKRLRSSCTQIGLELPWSDEEIANIINETLRVNDCNPEKDFGVRIVVTGGVSSSNIIPEGPPSLVVIPEPIRTPTSEMLQNGVKVITVDYNRSFQTAKTTNYMIAVVSQRKALQQNASEAIYVKDGLVSEGTTSNIFAFFKDTLHTPEKNVLRGVTRSLILDLAKSKFKVEISDLPYSSLLKADEVFISSATKRILPVVNVDGHKIGNGKPGPNTNTLMQLLNKILVDNQMIPKL